MYTQNLMSAYGDTDISEDIGEEMSFDYLNYSKSYIRVNAEDLLLRLTPAEVEFECFLVSLNSGVLCGRFKSQHVISGKWIVDFFFPEIRLAVEIDGSVHQKPEQIIRDKQKDQDCAKFDITLIRILNEEVFGNKEALRERLRDGWRKASRRENKFIGMLVSD